MQPSKESAIQSSNEKSVVIPNNNETSECGEEKSNDNKIHAYIETNHTLCQKEYVIKLCKGNETTIIDILRFKYRGESVYTASGNQLRDTWVKINVSCRNEVYTSTYKYSFHTKMNNDYYIIDYVLDLCYVPDGESNGTSITIRLVTEAEMLKSISEDTCKSSKASTSELFKNTTLKVDSRDAAENIKSNIIAETNSYESEISSFLSGCVVGAVLGILFTSAVSK